MKINQKVINGLFVRVDWIEFTIEKYEYTQRDVLECIKAFGFDTQHFDLQDKGGIGYKNSFKHTTEGIWVYFDGNENMGIHFRVSGSAVTYALDTFLSLHRIGTPFGNEFAYDIGDYSVENVLALYCEYVLSIGHFTRLDLAIDDVGCNYYSVSEIVDFAENRELVTRFHGWKNFKGQSFCEGCTGHTVYFGSRESDVMLRVYDKSLEQDVFIKWVRWELEIKHEKADVIANKIIECVDFGDVAMGVLKNYIRFIVPDKNRRSRCSLHPVWQKFIFDVERVKLSLPVRRSSVEDKENWIMKQCMPTIAGLIYSKLGDMSFLVDDLENQFERLSGRDKKLFENERGAVCE